MSSYKYIYIKQKIYTKCLDNIEPGRIIKNNKQYKIEIEPSAQQMPELIPVNPEKVYPNMNTNQNSRYKNKKINHKKDESFLKMLANPEPSTERKNAISRILTTYNGRFKGLRTKKFAQGKKFTNMIFNMLLSVSHVFKYNRKSGLKREFSMTIDFKPKITTRTIILDNKNKFLFLNQHIRFLLKKTGFYVVLVYESDP